MIKAIIFDVYGTIINTKDGSVKATELILEKNKSDLDPKQVYAKWKRYHAEQISKLVTFIKEEEVFLKGLERVYKEFEINGDAKEDVKIMLESLTGREVFEETLEIIDGLKNKYKVYIGSNTDTEPLMQNLYKNNITVDEVFTSEGLKVYKPKREFFENILEKIGCSSEEVIYIGDSQVDDIQGASTLNIKTAWINRKNQVLKEGIPKPNFEISNLKELFNFI